MPSNAQKIRNFVRITRSPFTANDIEKELDIPSQTIKNNLNILKKERAIRVISKSKGFYVYTRQLSPLSPLRPQNDIINQILAIASTKMIWKYEIIEKLKISTNQAKYYLHELVNQGKIEYDIKLKGYRFIRSNNEKNNQT